MSAVALSLAAVRADAQTGVIVGVVEDTLGSPVEGATILLHGERRVAVADSKGRFRLARVPSRQHRLIVRRIGFDSVDTHIEVTRDDTLSVVITLKPATISLAPVRVEAEEITDKLRSVGFDRRRKLSTTVPARQFITRAEIARRNPTLLSTIVNRAIGANSACANPTMFVDGALKAPPPHDPPVTIVNGRQARQVGSPPPRTPAVDEIPPSQVEGIEIYRGASQVPVEYKAAGRAAGCVMLIWTR